MVATQSLMMMRLMVLVRREHRHRISGVTTGSVPTGIGNVIGRYFIAAAQKDMRRHQVNLPDRDLAYFSEGSTLFDDYVEAVDWAQDYALLNRSEMMRRALEALGRLDDAEQAYNEALSIDHRLMPSLSARANLLAARGDWIGALTDLEMALTSRPNDPHLRLRRGHLLLRQGDWLRGLLDHEARLELPGERYAPDLPRWQGEPLTGRLLIYPEQADIESDAALRDTLMLARGVDATVQCSPRMTKWLDMPTVQRGAALDGFVAAAPLRSLPHLLGWTLEALPSPAALQATTQASARVGWFTDTSPPAGVEIERRPEQAAACRIVVGDDVWPVHLAARLGLPTIVLLPADADWLWGPRPGPSPWYQSAEVLPAGDAAALESRLALS